VAEAFLRRRRFWQRYDAFVHVPITGLKELDEPGAHDRGAIKWIARESTRVLRESLGARLKALRGTVLCYDKAEAAEEWVVVGLALDMEEARRLVDKGPPADDAQAAQQFREFWGPKAELRRFKDGRILETVVWGQSGQSSAETLEKVVFYVWFGKVALIVNTSDREICTG
jgi:U3 small nucleolar RNA-associated protein 22